MSDNQSYSLLTLVNYVISQAGYLIQAPASPGILNAQMGFSLPKINVKVGPGHRRPLLRLFIPANLMIVFGRVNKPTPPPACLSHLVPSMYPVCDSHSV